MLNSQASLWGDAFNLISLFLVLGICLATLLGRILLGRTSFPPGRRTGANWFRGNPGPVNRRSPDDADHREVLGRLRNRLPPVAPVGCEQEPTIVDLLSQIVDVNATLHTRLENAEGTLENQAAEITAYKSEARTDAMTGLANRRVFDETLRDRVTNRRRHGNAVSVLLVDIDHFKRFNDNYGHLAGDEVLAQVARVLRESMSEGDLVARIGGEEFAVVIENNCRRSVQTRAEHARREIQQADFVYEHQRLHVTVSVGGAELRDRENASSLVKRADVALYASKAAGRNLVHWHDGTRAIRLSPREADVHPSSGFASRGVAELTGTEDFGAVCHELRQRLLAVAAEES